MARIIMCGSFKGGVGKTASSWNLAYSQAEMGKRVLAVDFDSQANLTTCFGVEDSAAVLVARYEKISSQGKRNDIRQEIEALEETCGHDVHKSQKSRDGLGEEYGMTGRNIARYMRLDRLIPEFKDAVDKGTLAMVAAVDLSYLNVKMQKMIQQVAEAEGKKLKPKQAVELRKMGKKITKEAVESVLACKEKKKPQSVSVKLPVELYEKYFAQMDAGTVQEIMEKALEGYFGKEAAGV